jgi:hypothetical protein
VLRRQHVGLRRRVVFDHAARNHCSQPFAHVPLVQPRRPRNAFARSGRQTGHRIEQAGLVADAGHQRDRRFVDRIEQLCGKLLCFDFIQDLCLFRHKNNSLILF